MGVVVSMFDAKRPDAKDDNPAIHFTDEDIRDAEIVYPNGFPISYRTVQYLAEKSLEEAEVSQTTRHLMRDILAVHAVRPVLQSHDRQPTASNFTVQQKVHTARRLSSLKEKEILPPWDIVLAEDVFFHDVLGTVSEITAEIDNHKGNIEATGKSVAALLEKLPSSLRNHTALPHIIEPDENVPEDELKRRLVQYLFQLQRFFYLFEVGNQHRAQVITLLERLMYKFWTRNPE